MSFVALLVLGACSPPVTGTAGSHPDPENPKPPTGLGPGMLPPGTGPGQPTCGKQIEGPDIPCPDGGAPLAVMPDAGASAPTPGGPVTLKVRAWGATYTGVYLRTGETAEIQATGRWRAFGGIEVGPEGRSPNYRGCPRGSLVARIAKFHQRTCIGASGRITARRDGFVWLYQSEGWNAMQSTGELEASISGGTRDSRWREGMTALSIDPRLDPARIQAFESVCGKSQIPVLFEAEDPGNPRVQAYVRDYFGGDPEGWLSRAIVRGCALFYASPADFPRHFRDRQVRVVHTVSVTQAWAMRDRPPLRDHWDFRLNKTLEEITSMQPDYGPYGGPPVSIMHEVGHLLSPEGASGTLPKWLQEGYAETLPSNIGDDRTGFHNAIDNPESTRFGATFWWCDGTFGAPSFLDWIDEQHPGFLHGLTKASMALNGGPAGNVDNKRPWPGSNVIFSQITGKSFDDLWKGFAEAYAFAEHRPNRPVEECMDPRE